MKISRCKIASRKPETESKLWKIWQIILVQVGADGVFLMVNR